MTDRSNRAEVRNPVLALSTFKALEADLPIEARAAIIELCRAVQKDARERAEKCWKTHKGPMALYWRSIGVYAGHLARALK